MKRRTFLGSILALFAAPVLPRLEEEPLKSYSQTITIDQLRGPGLFTGQIGRYEGVVFHEATVDIAAVRASAQASLAQWLADQIDQSVFEELRG